MELLSQEIEKLVKESESRPDVEFAYSPKKAATECGSEIHANLEGLLKTAWLDYTRNKIKIRKSGVETSMPSQLRRARGSGSCASCRKVAAKSYAFLGSENAEPPRTLYDAASHQQR